MASTLFYCERKNVTKLQDLHELFQRRLRKTKPTSNLLHSKSAFHMGPILIGYNGRYDGAEFLISSAERRVEEDGTIFFTAEDLKEFCTATLPEGVYAR